MNVKPENKEKKPTKFRYDSGRFCVVKMKDRIKVFE